MAVLGRFGATRVEPAVLFDASELDGPGPPADAIDVQFRAPLSFSLLVDELLRSGRELDAQTCFTVYERAIERSVAGVQFGGGYVVDENGDAAPARLELTALGESEVPGFAEVRMHHHVWVGATAETLQDGRRWPVDQGQLRLGVRNIAAGDFLSELRRASEELLGVRWAAPQLGASLQIVEPSVHEQLAGRELGVCLSPWGARTIWEQPTPEELEREAQDVKQLAAHERTPTPGRVLDY